MTLLNDTAQTETAPTAGGLKTVGLRMDRHGVNVASPPRRARPGEPAARRPGPTPSGQRRGCREHD